MKIKNVVILVVLLMMGLFAGCSSGSKITRDLFISSDPAGAIVYMDGDKIGETPLKIQTFFTWNKDKPYDSLLRRVIQVRKAGYEPQTRDLYPIDMPNITFFLTRENNEKMKDGAK
jgi:PEGA domain